MISRLLEFWARLRGKPASAPKRVRTFSAAWYQANGDLRKAVDDQEWWELLSMDCAGKKLSGASWAAQEGARNARERQIHALWRLGWDDRAKQEQQRLDADRGWWIVR